MRRPLATQIGEEEQAIRAWGRAGRQRAELVIADGAAKDVAPPAQRCARGQRHRHQVIALRHRMTEGMQPSGSINGELFGMRKEHAAASDRGADPARRDNAGADRGGRVVTGPRRHGKICRQSQLAGDRGKQPATDLGALQHLGHPVRWNVEGGQDLRRPIAAADVEEQGSRCVGHVARQFTGELHPDEIFGQEHVAQMAILDRLDVTKPENLRRLEAGQCRVTGDLDQPVSAHTLGDDLALRCRSLIVPEQRWPDHLAALIEKDRAMHLPCEPNAGNIAARLGSDAAEHLAARRPPIGGVLLGPSGARHEERIFG